MDNQDEIKFVNALVNRRYDLGWSQTKVATMAGLSRETIAKMEIGEKMPRFTNVFKIASVLGVEITIAEKEAKQ